MVSSNIELFMSSIGLLHSVNRTGDMKGQFFSPLPYCSVVCTGGLFLIILRQAKRSGAYLTL